MHFVYDQCFNSTQRQSAACGGEKQCQTLGSGDQYIWWLAQHALAFALIGITGAGANFKCWQYRAEFFYRFEQIALNVVVQRFKRGDV